MITVSAVSFHLFPSAEAASLEERKDWSHVRRKAHRPNTFTHTRVRSSRWKRTPHLSSVCFLAVQLIVLTEPGIAPWQAIKSLRKWALTSCSIRDMAETPLRKSAIKHNQRLSCRAPMLRLETNTRVCCWQLVLPPDQVETLPCSAWYELTLSGPWNWI